VRGDIGGEFAATVMADSAHRWRLAQPGDPARRVTPLELFFDLVFVFAFTQVTAMVAGSPDLRGAVRGLVLGALLWWIWCSYSWLGNQARADEGVVRHAMFAGSDSRIWWWAGGMLVNYTGVYAAGADGWRLPSPAHFAERYSLIVLIALGESVVAIGAGVGSRVLTPSLIIATIAAIVLAITLWWLYFDVLAPAVEHHVTTAPSEASRTALARDALTFMHFPVVLSILGLAVGIKKVFGTLGGPVNERLSHGLHVPPALLLAGGPAVFLLAVWLLYLRVHRWLDRWLPVAAAVLLVVAGLAGGGVLDGWLSALGYLVIVSGSMIVVVVVVHRSQVDLRRRYRYGETPRSAR
jgi:low temperature requirement protein LtrA